MSDATDWLHGSCQCRGLRYRIPRKRVLTLYRCHCAECRKQSASAFGLSLKVRREDFEMLEGACAQWIRPCPKGGTKTANFCGTCGSRIYHGGAQAPILSLKAGLLEDIASLRPIGNIWLDSSLSFAPDPGDINYPKQPPNYERLYEAWKERAQA